MRVLGGGLASSSASPREATCDKLLPYLNHEERALPLALAACRCRRVGPAGLGLSAGLSLHSQALVGLRGRGDPYRPGALPRSGRAGEERLCRGPSAAGL